ncbi:hypothetical protein BH23VER1_BH23VER1_33500 [soil metagenome]
MRPTTTSAASTLIAAALLAVSSSTATAAFSLVSDFEGLTAGSPLNGQGGWTVASNANSSVETDPDDPGNLVGLLSATGGTSAIYHALGGGIANGTTGTLFFRARTTSAVNTNVGGSDVATPTSGSFGDFEAQLRFGETDNALDIRNGAAFQNDIGSYTDNIWFNYWLVIDNTTDMTTFYQSSGLDGAGDPLVTGAFRNGTTSAIDTFLVQANGAIYVDDVYIDTAGANLANPIPEPSLLALSLVGLGLLGLRRRR